MTSSGASSVESRVKPRRSTVRIATSRSSPSPGLIDIAAPRMRAATPGSKKRERSRAAALSLTERTSRWRAREMAIASTMVVSRMAMILSASA